MAADPPPVIVVGAGPAGGNIALNCVEAGLRTVLVDDNRSAGGQVWRRPAAGGGLRGLTGTDGRGEALRARIDAESARGGLSVFQSAEAIDIDPENRVLWTLLGGARIEAMNYRALVLATGAVEHFLPTPGWTLPGVFGVAGLQALLKGAGVVPGGRVALAGVGPLLYLVGAQLCQLGSPPLCLVDVAGPPPAAALAEMARAPGLLALGLRCLATLRRHGVRVRRRSFVASIGRTDNGLLLDIRRLGDGPGERLTVDSLGLGFGVRPNIEAALLAGCDVVYHAAGRFWSGAADGGGRSSVSGVYLAGDCTGIAGVDLAECRAPVVAASVIADLGLPVPDGLRRRILADRSRMRRLEAFRAGVAQWTRLPDAVFGLADDATVACRCEGVTCGEVRAAQGSRSSRSLKLETRAGMGLCQGKVCAPIVSALAGGLPSPPSARPPLRPTPAAAYAAFAVADPPD